MPPFANCSSESAPSSTRNIYSSRLQQAFGVGTQEVGNRTDDLKASTNGTFSRQLSTSNAYRVPEFYSSTNSINDSPKDLRVWGGLSTEMPHLGCSNIYGKPWGPLAASMDVGG